MTLREGQKGAIIHSFSLPWLDQAWHTANDQITVARDHSEGSSEWMVCGAFPSCAIAHPRSKA